MSGTFLEKVPDTFYGPDAFPDTFYGPSAALLNSDCVKPVLVIYRLSAGPVIGLTSRGYIPEALGDAFVRPLERIVANGPAPLRVALRLGLRGGTEVSRSVSCAHRESPDRHQLRRLAGGAHPTFRGVMSSYGAGRLETCPTLWLPWNFGRRHQIFQTENFGLGFFGGGRIGVLPGEGLPGLNRPGNHAESLQAACLSAE